MLKLKITSYFAKIALNLLINSNKLDSTVRIIGKTLVINSTDLEAADKILRANSIKYTIVC